MEKKEYEAIIKVLVDKLDMTEWKLKRLEEENAKLAQANAKLRNGMIVKEIDE